MSEETTPKKIMVASSIYGFEGILTQICATIEAHGFSVLNSHYGTIVPDSRLSNLDNCIKAVESCDVFIGIIRPVYGSGVIGDFSITHEEFKAAIRFDKKRYFVAHEHVPLCRNLLKQFMYDKDGRRTDFKISKTSVLDDIRVIDMYDEVIQSPVPVADRRGNWVQEFKSPDDLFRYLTSVLEAEK